MNDCSPNKILTPNPQNDTGAKMKSKELKAEATRLRILEAAYEEMYLHGYQGMRIDKVLSKTALAKGALYHHFPNKKALGYAVIDELIYPQTQMMYGGLLSTDDPIQAHKNILMKACNAMAEEDVRLGCPVNNLSQEMACLDEGFKERLCVIYESWSGVITESIELGQQRGLVRCNVNPKSVSIFIISAMQGVMGTAKCMQSKTVLVELTEVLCDYLESLRA